MQKNNKQPEKYLKHGVADGRFTTAAQPQGAPRTAPPRHRHGAKSAPPGAPPSETTSARSARALTLRGPAPPAPHRFVMALYVLFFNVCCFIISIGYLSFVYVGLLFFMCFLMVVIVFHMLFKVFLLFLLFFFIMGVLYGF